VDESTSDGAPGHAEQDAGLSGDATPPAANTGMTAPAGDAKETPADPPDQVTAPEATTTGAQRRRRPWLITGRVAVALVSAVALVATGIAWYGLESFRHSTNTTPVLSELKTAPNQPPADDGATDILLVGSDSRTDAQGRALPAGVLAQLRTQFDAGVNTDTIIVLRIPDNGGKAYAVSIPRDTYVSIPGWHDDKINAAYGVTQFLTAQRLQSSGVTDSAKIQQESEQAGQVALIESVQGLTGIHIDHYAEINLYGFYLLSKAIGGVDVCLKHATSDKNSGADFRAGEQSVAGSDALSFVRQRDNLPNGDIDRIVRQQVFLASAAKKILSAGTLTNPSALSGLLNTVRSSLTTDPGLDIAAFAQQAQSLVSGNVEFVTIPVVNDNATSPTGQSIVQVDVNAVHQFVANLVASSTAPPTTAKPSTPTAGKPATSTLARPAPTPTTSVPPAPTNEPTPPVSVNGVPCVD
jgi:LCP family protein required for cell wall assembly